MLAGHFATWVSSLKLTSVASATALQALQVAFVVLIDRLRGRPVRKAVVAGLLVSTIGVFVVSGVDLTLSTRALAGDLLALAGGAFIAVYVVIGGTMRQSLTTTAYTTLCYGTCTVTTLAFCLVGSQSLGGYEATTWVGLVAVTVSAQLLGHSIFNHLLAVMSPTVVSLTLLLEVPGAALLASIFLGQAPPFGVYVGLALVLTGLVIVVLRQPTPQIEAPVD
jgi:drug/metabolite transporter (DMT)-like permease